MRKVVVGAVVTDYRYIDGSSTRDSNLRLLVNRKFDNRLD